MAIFGAKAKGSFLRHAQESIRLMQEIGRASTEEGVASFGKLTGKEVTIPGTRVSMLPVASLGGALSEHHTAEALAHMGFSRDADGFGLLSFPKGSGLSLVDLLLGNKPGSSKTFGDLESSAVAESANIALNAMLTAVATHAEASFKSGVPETTFDAAKVLDGLVQPPHGQDHAIVLETSFEEASSKIHGTMVLVFFTKAGVR